MTEYSTLKMTYRDSPKLDRPGCLHNEVIDVSSAGVEVSEAHWLSSNGPTL